ncbi:MAG: receptor [Bacteroidetes bacterium]|nr:receptor [Bacteroidota bacterium]
MIRAAILVLLLTSRVAALAQIKINDSLSERVFMPYELTYFVDVSNHTPFQKIISDEWAEKFRLNRSYQNIDFKNNASYWIRLPIQPNSQSKKIWLLEFYDQTIDSLEAYVPQPDGSYHLMKMGDHQRFSERSIHHKNFEILLNRDERVTRPYYFKVRSHEFADVRIALRSVDRFIYYALNEYYLYGMFYGMIVIIALYNFLVYLAIKEVKFIYYIFYILCVALYAMSYDGIGFQYLWPTHPAWNDWAVGVSLYLLIFWSLVFTRRFLSTRANSPRLDRALKYMIIARSVWFVFTLIFLPKMFTFRGLDIIPLSLIFFTGINVWRGGYRPARFFVISYGLLFTGFFIRTLVYFNLFPFTILTHYSLHLSFVLEMLFLTVALGDRIRILKDNRDRALKRVIRQQQTNIALKEKVNRELEEKVNERTQELGKMNEELMHSNAKLDRQAHEINQINSILDLDNWKLKNKVKEVLEERMHEELMTFEEFSTLYPDEMACYRFLEKRKETAEFQCLKCSNAKYSPGTQKFSRRCTKCGYNESITAGTLFQAIKFPIAKAFYLTYVIYTHKNHFTLEKLSTILEMRLSTIWAFRKKVSERIHFFEKRDKPQTSWEDLVVDIPIKNRSTRRKHQTPA